MRLFKNKKKHTVQNQNGFEGLRVRILAPILLILSICFPPLIWANTAEHNSKTNVIRVEQASVSIKNTANQNQVWLDVLFNLSGLYPLQETLDKGVDQFKFVYEFEWRQSRWYWLDKIIARKQIVLSVSVSPFDKKYRLEHNGQVELFPDFPALVRRLSTPANFAFFDLSDLSQGSEYELWIRFSLDETALPRLIQIDRINNNEWRIDTGWFKKRIELSAPIVDKSGAVNADK